MDKATLKKFLLSPPPPPKKRALDNVKEIKKFIHQGCIKLIKRKWTDSY